MGRSSESWLGGEGVKMSENGDASVGAWVFLRPTLAARAAGTVPGSTAPGLLCPALARSKNKSISVARDASQRRRRRAQGLGGRWRVVGARSGRAGQCLESSSSAELLASASGFQLWLLRPVPMPSLCVTTKGNVYGGAERDQSRVSTPELDPKRDSGLFAQGLISLILLG